MPKIVGVCRQGSPCCLGRGPLVVLWIISFSRCPGSSSGEYVDSVRRPTTLHETQGAVPGHREVPRQQFDSSELALMRKEGRGPGEKGAVEVTKKGVHRQAHSVRLTDHHVKFRSCPHVAIRTYRKVGNDSNTSCELITSSSTKFAQVLTC